MVTEAESSSKGVGRLVEDLCDPRAYPHEVQQVELLRTHISLLFFAGERVYKVKKPVDLGFLDYTSLERRRRFCEEEVRLNRRLAPRVYLGVAPISRSENGRLRVHGDGEPVEWAVEMVRLPEAHMLSSLLDHGVVDNGQMRAIAALLARFHAEAATGEGVDEYGSPAAISGNTEENFEQLRPFVVDGDDTSGGAPAILSRPQYDFLHSRCRIHQAELTELFEERVSAGRIREGHGDLHAGNLCLTAGEVVAYDCIEFNRRFRCGDGAADLAFLAMDLDHRGFHAFSDYLSLRYGVEASDAELGRLLPFYKSYRALVRCKVSALTALDRSLEASRRAELRHESMRYAHLAVAYDLPPVLILLCGLPASGKSWLARHLARPLRASVLRSDVRRKLLAGLSPTRSAQTAYGEGLYSEENKRRTYRSLAQDAAAKLRAGRSVVVDATSSMPDQRSPFFEVAEGCAAPCLLVWVEAPEETIRERLAARAQDPSEASDADLEVYLQARSAFVPPDELPDARVLKVLSGRPPEDCVSDAIDRLLALTETP